MKSPPRLTRDERDDGIGTKSTLGSKTDRVLNNSSIETFNSRTTRSLASAEPFSFADSTIREAVSP